MRRIWYGAGGGVALVALYFVAALIGALLPGTRAAYDGDRDVLVGLVSGPIHYDFLLPLDPTTRQQFAFAEDGNVPVLHPGAQWLLVGWGAEDFYTTVGSYTDVSLRAVWRGITGDSSVMRVEAIGPLSAEAEVPMIALSLLQYEALLRGIAQSFDQDAGAPLVLHPAGEARRGAFFQADGRFDIGRTCNQWVGRMLREAGVRFGGWTPIPTSVRLSLWRFDLTQK